METLLPTTKHRRGRRTARQERALADPGEALITSAQLASHPSLMGDRPLILDIGFGAGEAVVTMASADKSADILAVDTHTPGIGDLLATIREQGLRNILVVEADIRHVLPAIPKARLAGARTFFPDPWPKKRHQRRRLITTDFANDLAVRVSAGGFWHLATDWSEYADVMEEQIGSSSAWRGGRTLRPEWRPETRYERRGRAAGRSPIDLWFERSP
ncbi:MAG: tRNA (guanine(46)-N(7))-methyltransferase TrmB [Candidatus Nanopelagicales bacterium]